MFNEYVFEEQTQWVKRDCSCDTCEKKIDELTERCMLAEGEIVSVDDLYKTINKIQKNETAIITLAEDLTLENDEKLVIPEGSNVVVDLNNKTLNYTSDDIIFRVNGNLTIKNGNVKSVGYVASANAGSTITVVDGNYDVEVTSFQANGGKILIEGGYYTASSEKFGSKYLLNHIDSKKNDGMIKVVGGKFVNFNPSASESEDPVMNFVPKGYKVIEMVDGKNTIYEVVKE